MKMKFDKKAILGFTVEYVEKAVFACVVLCFLFLVYKSFTREHYETKPDDLKTAADSAIRAIERTLPPPKDADSMDNSTIDYQTIIEEISDPISEEAYRFPKPFNPPIFTPRSKRGMPNVYSVESLRVTPGVGRLEKTLAGMGGAMVDGAGLDAGAGGMVGQSQQMVPQGSRWVMLTGLVDVEKQTKALRECFKDAVKKNPQYDNAPVYYAFWVERAEISNSDNPEDLQWEQPYKSLRMELQKCGGSAKSTNSDGYVDAQFIESRLTFPLPRRLDQDWDESVAHLPEIPLLSFEAAEPLRSQIPREEQQFQDDFDDPGAAFGDPRRRGAMGTGMPGGMMGAPGRFARRNAVEEVSPYLLFRFIDFNVEPGKRYRYRVRIGIYNPNFYEPIEPRHLIPELQRLIAEDKDRKPAQKKWKKYIRSDWSEPSDVVAVPHDDQFLLVSVDPARRIDSEPEAKIMALHWDMQNGMHLTDEIGDISRGKVVNFFDHKIKKDDAQGRAGRNQPGRPGNRVGGDAALLGGMPGGGMGMPGMGLMGGKQGSLLPETVDFETKCLVLDIRGGERLPGKNRDMTEPGEMLLMDPSGNIIIKSDISDFKQYRNQKYPPSQQPGMRRSRPAGGMGGDPGMMGIEGGF